MEIFGAKDQVQKKLSHFDCRYKYTYLVYKQ